MSVNEFPVDPGNGADVEFEDPFEVEFDEQAANEAYAEFERMMDDFPETETDPEDMTGTQLATEPSTEPEATI